MILTQEFVDRYELTKGQIEIFDDSFPHHGSFGLRVSYGGRKSYFYNYTLAGKRLRITVGIHPTLSLLEARKETDKMAYQVAVGKDPKAEKKILGRAYNFDVLCQWYFELNVGLNNKTLNEYKRIYKKELVDYLGNRKPSDITQEDINLIIRKIGTERGKKTLANRTRSLLHRIFEFAIEQGVLLKNPATGSEGYLLTNQSKNTIPLADLKKIFKALDALNPSLSSMFKIFMLTAQPAKLVQNLRWDSLRLDQIHIDDYLQIPLNSVSIQLIKALRFPNGKLEYVFGKYGSQHYSSMQRNFKKVISLAKLDYDSNLDTLRRSIELELRKIGINHFVIAYILQNKTEVNRLKGLRAINIENDVRIALESWAKLLTSIEKNPKVIQLFK